MGEEVGMSLGGEKLTAFGCSKVNGIEEHGDYLFVYSQHLIHHFDSSIEIKKLPHKFIEIYLYVILSFYDGYS